MFRQAGWRRGTLLNLSRTDIATGGMEEQALAAQQHRRYDAGDTPVELRLGKSRRRCLENLARPLPGGTVNAIDMSDLLTLLLVALAVLALLGMAVIVFVMWRYRIPPSGLIAMIGALVYLASPIDVLPEAMLGPFGLLDDAGAVTAAAVFVYKLVTVKRRLQDAGVKGRRRPDLLE
jgi:uncharacterized membrane protein YkvA (DUF1232 family)